MPLFHLGQPSVLIFSSVERGGGGGGGGIFRTLEMYNVVDKDGLWASDLPGIRKLIQLAYC